MANAIPLSTKFSIIEEESTDVTMSFVAAISVAVNTDDPVTPVAPPKTKIVIVDADITFVNVHANQVSITPQIFLNNPALTIYPVTKPQRTLTAA